MLDTYNNGPVRAVQAPKVHSSPMSGALREKSKSHRSIKLMGVHSIDRSQSSTKNITKVKPGKQEYEKIIYY